MVKFTPEPHARNPHGETSARRKPGVKWAADASRRMSGSREARSIRVVPRAATLVPLGWGLFCFNLWTLRFISCRKAISIRSIRAWIMRRAISRARDSFTVPTARPKWRAPRIAITNRIPSRIIIFTWTSSRVRAPIQYEDEARIYPHIYGALNRDAIVAVRAASRGVDGTFLEPEPLPN